MPQPDPEEEMVVVCFDVSRSCTPESFQEWKCDLRKYIEEEFRCGQVAIIKVTGDSFASPPQTFKVKCPKKVPWGHIWDQLRKQEELQVQREKERVLAYIHELQPEADHTDLQGAFLRAKEDLRAQVEGNPRMGKKPFHIRVYSDFQAPLRLPRGERAGSHEVLSNVTVHLIFGAPQPEYQSRRRTDPVRPASQIFEEAREKWTSCLVRIGFSPEQLHWRPVLADVDCDQPQGPAAGLLVSGQ